MFKENLKKLRNEKHLSQDKLAEILNIGQTTISQWELGQNEPKASAIIKIAKFFNVSTDYLLGVED